MSIVTWITEKGDLGTVPENQFFSKQFEAVDRDSPTTYQIANISRNSGTVTVTTETVHSYAAGDVVNIFGLQTDSLNGRFAITEIVSATEFRYLQAGSTVTESDGSGLVSTRTLFYSYISGTLPGGMYITRAGELRGVPTILSSVNQSAVYGFTVRATNSQGKVADRSFVLTVSNVSGPIIVPRPNLVGAFFDGEYLEYQFESINNNPSATETWRVISGDIPPGTTLSADGKLSGYIEVIASNTADLGYEAAGIDTLVFDVLPESTDRNYNFTIQVTDGNKYDALNVRVLVVSKANFTGDNDITIINNSFIRIDQDNRYRPIILNSPDSLPTRVVGDMFAYKFLGYDPEDEDISWRVDELAFSGMDELDGAVDQIITGTGSAGPYTLDQAAGAAEICVRVNNILLTAIQDYDTVINQLTFTNYSITSIVRVNDVVTVTVSNPHSYQVGDIIDVYGVPTTNMNGRFVVSEVLSTTQLKYLQGATDATDSSGTLATRAPNATDVVEVLFISALTGFDTILYDQGQEGLPLGLQINEDTGWLFGTLPAQTEDIKTYEVAIKAFRTLQKDYQSDTVFFKLNIKRTRNEEIIWETPADLGQIDNGAISEITIKAYNTVGKELEYSIIYQPYRRLPQGLRMLRSGVFAGKVTFRYFSLDSARGFLPLVTTQGLEVGMSIQGVGVASGCEITELPGPGSLLPANTIEVRPAIYIVQGTPLTFSNENNTVVISTSANAISTIIDGGDTTFDQNARFSVKATAIDGSISSVKSFKILVRPQNLAPYENLFLKALVSEKQRLSLQNILEDPDIIPPSLIYRPSDPFFGLQKNLKFLFLPGLSSAKAATVVNSIANNHYTKSLNFGNIKTARAVDNAGNITYEVVYVEVLDNQQFAGKSPPLSITLKNQNKFQFGSQEYNTIFVNSFPNMQYRLESGIGYTNRGALPRWMTSVQENGYVLGLTRAVVLAYTKPGSSKLVAYRIQNSGFALNSIDFVVDRYQWDNYLSKFYDIEANRFLPSRDTTFDKYPNLGVGSDVVIASVINPVTNSNNVTITDNLAIGYGWICTNQDTLSDVNANTAVRTVTLTSVGGQRALNIVLNSNISASPGAVLKFDGSARVDYAVSVAFNKIDSNTVGRVKALGYIDGVTNFVENELIIFVNQTGFKDEPNNEGWVRGDGTTYIPGYLEKLSGQSSINQRGGAWQLTWEVFPTLGFDNDSVGFDQESAGFVHSRYDQGGDAEIYLDFQNEININQTVKVRTGKTFPASTLQYRPNPGEAVPRYRIFTGSLASEETTFDGGSCQCREGDPGKGGVRGGTAFSNNRDKYIKPESEDKYIKFPQNGVFV